MERIPIITTKKAELIEVGRVRLAMGTRLSVYPIRDHGGPTSTERHIVLSSGKMFVKVALEEDKGKTPFVLESMGKGDRYVITKDGDRFLDDVELVPVGMHAPGQAFLILDERCSGGCLFCTSTGLDDEKAIADVPASRWVDMVMKTKQVHSIEAVALTSGTGPDMSRTMALFIDVIKGIKYRYPDMPVGVEPNATTKEDLIAMRDAGAEELKINVQTFDPLLFRKVCPGLDRALIIRMLGAGVRIFGRNKVASNVIIGLGEEDQEVLSGVESLAKVGVLTNIRVLRASGPVRSRLEEAGLLHPVDKDRMLRLAVAQKEIFAMNGLDPGLFKTMCHRCGCCDICVGKDI